jgi:membrane complex biogenesis BtpA family protein
VSLAVAVAAGCEFIRAEGWTHAHISDKGVATASAGDVIRYRYHIGASDVAIFADVRKKHASHAITADLTMEELVTGMALHRADGVIVTGSTTGSAPLADVVRRAQNATTLPVLVGSGVTLDNLKAFFHCSDGFIVGSAFKEGGVWDAPVSEERVKLFVAALETARTAHRTELAKN